MRPFHIGFPSIQDAAETVEYQSFTKSERLYNLSLFVLY